MRLGSHFTALLWLAALSGCSSPSSEGNASSSSAAQPPDIVLILVDDMGYADVSVYGAPDCDTPRIDRLASEGVRFTAFYSGGPECTPTRTALLTGRYLQRAGGLECAIGTGNVGRYDDAIRLAEQHELGLPPSMSVLPSSLKRVGYSTAVFGKWHLGYEPEFLPSRHGFDRFFGVLGGNCDYFTHREYSDIHVLYEGDRPVEREGYLTHLITDEAIRFLREPRESPRFLYVSYTTPHFPYQGPGDAELPMTEESFTKGTRAKYVEMVEDLDREVGRLLDVIEETGRSRETVLVFASDNGGTPLASHGPFSGTKGGLFEGGIRVPLIVRWPGRLPAGRVSTQVTTTMDLTASFLRIAGVTSPEGRSLDGLDIVQHVEDGASDFERPLFWRARRGDRTWRAVRMGNLKYVRRVDRSGDVEWLFDLAKDPGESSNLLERAPAEASRLKGLLSDWEREVQPVR